MEVLRWDQQAKASTQRFPSIFNSTTHSLHDLGQITCSLVYRSTSLLEIRSVHSLCPQKRKEILLLLCPNIWQAQSSIVSKAGSDGLTLRGRCNLYTGRSPDAESFQPTHPNAIIHWQMPFTPDLRWGRNPVWTTSLCSSFWNNLCSLLRKFVSPPLNSNSSIYSAPGHQYLTICLLVKDPGR